MSDYPADAYAEACASSRRLGARVAELEAELIKAEAVGYRRGIEAAAKVANAFAVRWRENMQTAETDRFRANYEITAEAGEDVAIDIRALLKEDGQ